METVLVDTCWNFGFGEFSNEMALTALVAKKTDKDHGGIYTLFRDLTSHVKKMCSLLLYNCNSKTPKSAFFT